MGQLVARIKTSFLPHFKRYYPETIKPHVEHKYSRESSLKSEIVRAKISAIIYDTMMHGKHAMPITYGVHFVIGTCVRNHHYFLKLRNHNGFL